MVWKEVCRTATAGTHCRWGFLPGAPRGAGSIPRGTAVQPAWRSSRHGAGSTYSEKESLASSEMWHRLLLTYLKQALRAGWEEPPAFASSSCSKSPRSCSFQPVPTPSLFSAALCNPCPAPRALVHPGFGTVPVLWCHPVDFSRLSLA